MDLPASRDRQKLLPQARQRNSGRPTTMRLQLEKQVAQQWLRLPIFVLKAGLEIEALICLAPALRLPRQPPSALFSRNFSTGVPLLLR